MGASQVSGGQSWQRPPAEANDPYAETVPLEVLQSPILQDPDTIKTKQQQDVNNYLQERQLQLATFIQQPSFNEGPCSQFPPGTEEYEFCCALNPGVCNNTFTGLVYYYHPDHLGSSTAITDKNGKPYQFFLNLPFGEIAALAEILRTPMKNRS